MVRAYTTTVSFDVTFKVHGVLRLQYVGDTLVEPSMPDFRVKVEITGSCIGSHSVLNDVFGVYLVV